MKKHDKCLETRPETVSIVGMGFTANEYIKSRNRYQDWSSFTDETWGVNFVGNWLKCDKIFLMDGITDDKGVSNTSEWEQWATQYIDTPIICPFAIKELKSSVRYPLEQVINATQDLWFGNTIAYMIAYACSIGVKQLHMYGCDFSYEYKEIANRQAGENVVITPERMQQIQGIEIGHAAVTYWMGIAQRFNMQIVLPTDTTLANSNNRTFYGYGNKQPLIRIKGITQ